MSARLLDRERSALVIVDVQEAFRGVVGDFDRVAANVAVLARGAREIGVPVLVTEQYPRGLGETVAEVADALGEAPRIEKTVFSAARAAGFDLGGREQALVCGIEAHVCVSQTVHDLLERGVQVHVAADAVASRAPDNREVGLRKMAKSGAILSSTETALFEWLERAGTPEFRDVQALLK